MIWEYRGFQEVTGGYKGLQGVTRGYKGLQWVTRGYMGLQERVVFIVFKDFFFI